MLDVLVVLWDWLKSLPVALMSMNGITIATTMEAVAVLIAAFIAIRQLREFRAARRDESRAYVIIYLRFREDTAMFLPSLVLENVGATAAFDISITCRPPMRSTLYEDGFGPTSFIEEGIATLSPGQSITTLFDSMIARNKRDDFEDQYEIEIGYTDRYGLRHTDPFSIDLRPYWHVQTTTLHGIHDVHKQLEHLVKEFRHFRTGFGGELPVTVERRAATLRRHRIDRFRRGLWRGMRQKTMPSTVLWSKYLCNWIAQEIRALWTWMRASSHP